MIETFTDEKRLRRYLLNDLSDDEQVTIEARLLVDPAYLEQLQIVEEDLIDDYLRQKLSSSDRTKFEKQFNNPACLQKIQLAGTFQRYLDTLPPPVYPAPSLLSRVQELFTQFISPPVLRAVAAVLVLTFGFGIWWMMQRSDSQRGLNALQDAYDAARPLEARISGFPYARFYGAPDQTTARINAAELQLANKVFQNLQNKERSPEALHALGKYHLTERRFNESIETLSAAVAAKPNEAQLQVDLSTAWLEKGRTESNNQQNLQAEASFHRSRTHLEQALQLKPDLPEALFNLALLHHTRGVWSEAERAWRLYLEKDPSSPWAQEAKQYLEQALKAQQ